MYRQQRSEGKSFGLAKDYYRIRHLQVDEEVPVDLEWRSDILYSSPKAYPSRLKVTYRLQVVTAENIIHEIAIVKSKKEAKERLRKMKQDLHELTKMEFDDKYGIEDSTSFTPSQQGNTIVFTGIQGMNGDD
ncbi:MAG TPA: hypothetical protein VE439_08605 [Anaerolineae bacterium]|jgi:hypothetical protein|nr:hypothetical protein [Anaerolineae bacterium]